MTYRKLTEQEISLLIFNGCSCPEWEMVEVSQNFDPMKIKNSRFSGQIRLGEYQKEIDFFGGVKKNAGIYDATIHNCNIGNNVYIGNVKNYIANYDIADDVLIENVDIIAVCGECNFGNGIEVSAINEAGGREITIFDKLTAQIAYFMALYRHVPKVIEKLNLLISQYVESVTTSMGHIGKGSKILNCRTIKNVKFGDYCLIEGIYRLTNGSINSSQNSPTYFGEGVIAENFVTASGAKITDATLVSNCFVGQGTNLGKHYSAENSVFFANCIGLHGEACSIFAGPFTVTHHKSTLLIAGMFSFLNAGSGSNQSNHLYKLGPIHQGIVERGSKTTSNSYMLWPTRIGVFSMVMGRHYKNSDLSNMPFSYLIESADGSLLVPGVNLRSVGTIRDAQKWPGRDVRFNTEKLDLINFNLLSPYTIGKVIKGRDILRELKAISGENSEYYSYQSVKIKNSSLQNGLSFYDLAITKFTGNALVKKIETHNPSNVDELQKCLAPNGYYGVGDWVDIAGMYAPKELIDELLTNIETGKINSIENIHEKLKDIHDNYYIYAWNWILKLIEKENNKEATDFSVEEITKLVRKWQTSVITLDEKLLEDASKEFGPFSQIGFGIDGSDEVCSNDFEQVRGCFTENSFVKSIQEHICKKRALGNKVIEILNQIK